MTLKQRFTHWRRQRVANEVVVVGKKLSDYRIARASIDGQQWPHDAQYLDSRIEALERRRGRLLDFIKNTA